MAFSFPSLSHSPFMIVCTVVRSTSMNDIRLSPLQRIERTEILWDDEPRLVISEETISVVIMNYRVIVREDLIA
jgi:hypothetical protein